MKISKKIIDIKNPNIINRTFFLNSKLICLSKNTKQNKTQQYTIPDDGIFIIDINEVNPIIIKYKYDFLFLYAHK